MQTVSLARASVSLLTGLEWIKGDHGRVCSVDQVWNEQHPGEETLAMVVRTGLCTAVGSMLRQVMAPSNATNPFWDPFVKVI